MAKRIADLEKELVKWREVADEQAARLRKIAEESDKQFANSHLKASMEREIEWLKQCDRMSRQLHADVESELSRLKSTIKTVVEENQALCAAHDTKYWIGLTRDWLEELRPYERRAKMEITHLEKEVANLQGEIAERDKQITYLRGLLRDKIYEKAEGYVPETKLDEKTGKRGRPVQIDGETKKRIRKLKKNGFSVRRIAEIEGVSPSSVQKVIKAPAKP